MASICGYRVKTKLLEQPKSRTTWYKSLPIGRESSGDTSHQREMPTANLVILRVAGNRLIPDLGLFHESRAAASGEACFGKGLLIPPSKHRVSFREAGQH